MMGGGTRLNTTDARRVFRKKKIPQKWMKRSKACLTHLPLVFNTNQRTLTYWWCKFTDATHLVSKIMHQNLAVILWQFNYGKNSFIVLSRVNPGLTEQNSETSMLVQITLTYFERRNITVLMTYYLTCLDWTKQVNMLLMVRCRHSSVDSSALTILPPGFESQAHHLSFYHL